VSQRTEELEDANAALREIDARRRLFFSKVSHELRTPVTVIRGEAELALRQRGDVSALRGAMQHLLDSSIFLQRRLDDLLALARAEDGALAITLDRVDLAAILREVATTAGSFAEMSEVRLSLANALPRSIVMGDGERLAQALLAIIDNAVKFTPPGGMVRIALEERAAQAIISVQDEGPGVEEAHLSAIFEPYASLATGRGRSGAGLGLAIAHWIASAHGGDIRAASSGMGEGLCVTISLPVAV
jgi:signal transduction histidine kinase